MLQVAPDVFDSVPCYFPTEDLQEKPGSLRSVPVPLRSCVQSIPNHAPISTDILLAAWAVVLRYYVGSDVISFGQIDDTASATSRFAVYHGEITADTRLKSLSKPGRRPLGNSNTRQLPRDWMLSCSSLNTVVWRKGQSSQIDELQDLESTQVWRSHSDKNTSLTDQCALILAVSDADPESETSLVYAPDTIADIIASSVAEAVARTTAVALGVEDVEIGQLDILGQSSWERIQEWNATVPPLVQACLHELIDERASRCPDATALTCWDGVVTYAELADYTSRLGKFLIDQGVGPELFIPVCFDKSLWAVVSMLGVLKAGGAFVCVDPAQPLERLRTITEEVEATIALAAPPYTDMVTETGPKTIAVDSGFIHSLPPCLELPKRAEPHNPAFAIFTSGSTGKPKGIVQEHRAVCSSAMEHRKTLKISSETRSFQFAAYTFIVNTFELFTPLIEGGCVCVPSKEDRLGRTAGAMRDLGANWATFTPSFLRSIKPEDVPSVETITMAGEPVQEDNLKTWGGRVNLVNMYGSSECSVCVTGDFIGGVGRSTIGRAVGSVSWIADTTDHNRLAPVGAIGELLMEGPALAREYIHQPDKTAAAFIENPPWLKEIRAGTPTRVYKTGDLVRYGSDGRLNLVGRKDMQVKLRGQRIEIEEVEFHLRQAMPRGVEAAAGLVRPVEQPGKPFIAGFVALKKSFGEDFESVDAESIAALDSLTSGWKNKLSSSLPGYMVPSALVKLGYLPLTASGKLNRKPLSTFASQLTMASLTSAPNKGHREPATETGRMLRKLWAQTLQASEDGISGNDNFLQLGGNSIDAMQLVNLARQHGFGLSVGEIFSHPELDDMARVCSTLSNDTKEDVPFSLIDRSLDVEQLCESVAAHCQVSKSAIEDLYPCTAMQEGLMALSDAREGVYMAQHTLALGSNVDLRRFKQACQQVVAANPILRTRIAYPERSAALQVVLRAGIDWRSGENLEAYLTEDKENSMKAGKALTRYAIVPDNDGWTFVWTVHHAVYDAWTLDLVFDRIDKAYKQQPVEGDTPFKEFMRYVAKSDVEVSTKFWQEYLAGSTSNEFPSVVSTAKQPVADGNFQHEMPLSRTDQLAGITMPSLIRAAWGILVGSHSESEDVVFGSIVSGRNAPVPNVDRLVGPGIAAVPVRVKLPDSTLSVLEFVSSIQEDSTRMIPFEQTGLQHIRRVSPEATAACDFQTLLVVQPAKERQPTTEPDLRAVSEADANFGTYALTLECILKADGIVFNAHYDSTLVSEVYVKRILSQLAHLMQQFCSSAADRKIGDLTIISPQDQESIRGWNQSIPPRVNKAIHDLVGERISDRPNRQAVCSWDGELTYAELDVFSAKLARRLVQLGVEPESFVPSCFEKTRWSIVAMLAILRAGGAFLNIDPSQPQTRIKHMITKVNGKTIVCSPAQYELCRQMGDEYSVVPVDLEELQTVNVPESLPLPQVDPDSAAYVIFTSGSTGEPKGTIIEHGQYCSGAVTHGPGMLMHPSSRALQFASFTFDASLVEILTTLILGGCVCVPSEEQRKRDVTEAIRNTSATWAALTPSFVNLINPDDVPSLEVLVLAGEAMSQSHIDTWAHRVKLVNGYGPSECCVCSTSNRQVTSTSSPRDIGRACSGVAWVVMPNDHNRLVPVGCVGELVIEGWNVGRGYLNDPVKTQAAFVENPRWLDTEDMARPPTVYKTGDLVKYNPGGSFNFQRRKDTQVKLRGQRVELGEIEYRVKQSLPNKPDAVVDILSPEDAKDQPRLVAFIPLAHDNAVNGHADSDSIIPPPSESHVTAVSGLEDRLADFLPTHMIPSAYLPVHFIPKMPSGKADRKALIRYGSKLTHRQMAEYSGAVQEVRPPTTDMQLTMQQLWSECLKMPADQISLNDNFIRLGGDSITAMRLASAARTKGIPLSTATVFQHPTLEAISAVAESLAEQQQPQTFEEFSTVNGMSKEQLLEDVVLPQVDVPVDEIQDVVEATDFQALAIRGGLTTTRGWSNYLVFDMTGPIDLRRLQTACEQLVAKHAILRTVFATCGSQMMQVILRPFTPAFAFHVRDDEDPSETIVREDLSRPVSLGDPIVRFILVKDGATKHRLMMRISHAQYDGSSMPLLLQDLRAAYRGDILPKRPRFSDFVRMQQRAGTEASREFFAKMLSGSQMTTVVSHSQPSTANVLNTMIADTVPLVSFKSHGITSASVVKAAWALVLAEMAATSDVVYGHMVSGRNLGLDNVESVMGPCLNIVPVRVNFETLTTVLDLLHLIQIQQTTTIPHESLGFQQIIERCSDWPSGTRFSSVFQYQEFGGEDASQPITMEGPTSCSPGFICPAPDACDLSILATPTGDRIRIEMIFSDRAMSRSFAEETMKRVCSKVAAVAADPNVNAELPPLADLRSNIPQIPLPEPGRHAKAKANGFVNGIVNGINGVTNGMADGVNDTQVNGANGMENGIEHKMDEKINLLASVSVN